MDTTSSLRVLVVDDCRDTADSLGQLITLWGHAPLVAYGSQTALELATIYQPHVALLDLAMPHMDGIELARRLRGSARTGRYGDLCADGHHGGSDLPPGPRERYRAGAVQAGEPRRAEPSARRGRIAGPGEDDAADQADEEDPDHQGPDHRTSALPAATMTTLAITQSPITLAPPSRLPASPAAAARPSTWCAKGPSPSTARSRRALVGSWCRAITSASGRRRSGRSWRRRRRNEPELFRPIRFVTGWPLTHSPAASAAANTAAVSSAPAVVCRADLDDGRCGHRASVAGNYPILLYHPASASRKAESIRVALRRLLR